MKKYFLIVSLILFGFSGCSQNDHHLPGKIPIDAKRWYQLNNTSTGMDELFDGKQNQNINTLSGAVLKHYEAWYPILDGEQMTIDSIMMFDGQGTNEDQPMAIYAITDNWKKTPIAQFTGKRYNEWDGPDPAKPDVYALVKPVSNVRYLVIDSWGRFPGELEFYGPYVPPLPTTKAIKKYPPLRNFFGVNAFEWDFEDGANPGMLDTNRLNAIKCFTGIRHYLDWEKLEPEEGQYTFNPAKNGGWNYDIIYEWCKNQGIVVLPCLKTVPQWMLLSYPEGQRDAENVPARYGRDLNDPASYIEQAKMAFQFAARYGKNKNVDRSLLSVYDKPRWTNDPVNEVKVGMGLVQYMECDNERDKWWKGRKAYQTGREYAANLSAFYDGNKGKMGPGVGVKNADTSIKVVMAGLAMASTDYVRGMIDWSREFRGKRADGSVDLPWDIINYHYYANDGEGNRQTTGIAPEASNAAAIADNFIQMAHEYAGDIPVWVTETGYDINEHSVQKAPAIHDKTALETQGDWILRTSLLYAKSGIQRLFFYELDDDNINNSTKYASSGLINADRTRRPAADFLYETNKLFGSYTYEKTLDTHAQTANNELIVDKYGLKDRSMFVLVVPDQSGRTTKYTLDLGNADTAYIYTPKAGSDDMDVAKMKTTNGQAEITVTETPVFVTGYDCRTGK